ncbi:DeoR/GlpR family DNA-binding transcription regulator [Cereibacter sp. SYSU M97828]|nr:DeoR/GlpR family DNA-binding transcription regulator [Cereibacter flavus]
MDGLSERQESLLAAVRTQGFVTIDAMARQFDVSAQSVRRDIIHLDQMGLLQRFHGGAGPVGGVGRLDYRQKQVLERDAKAGIGRRAADLIPPGASVFLDVGTTVEAVAAALAVRQGLRIFTSSLACAQVLIESGNDVFVFGGAVLGPDGSMGGETVLAGLRDTRFDFAVLGFSGVDSDGALMDYDAHKIAVKRTAASRSACVMAVGTSTKLARVALRRIIPAEDLQILVTDKVADQGEAMRQGGVEVIAAA